MSIILEEILEKVKDSDLEHFKQKITKMEEEQEARLHSQDLESINDIVKRKYLDQLKHIEDAEATFVDATPLVENTSETTEAEGQPTEKNSDTLYQEFLKKLKG
jgi:glucokinase